MTLDEMVLSSLHTFITQLPIVYFGRSTTDLPESDHLKLWVPTKEQMNLAKAPIKSWP